MNTLEVIIKGDQGAGKTTLHEIIKNGLLTCAFEIKEYEKDEKGIYVGEINAQPTEVTITEEQTLWTDRLEYSVTGSGPLRTLYNLILFLKNQNEVKGLTDPREIGRILENRLQLKFRLLDIEAALAYLEKQNDNI